MPPSAAAEHVDRDDHEHDDQPGAAAEARDAARDRQRAAARAGALRGAADVDHVLVLDPLPLHRRARLTARGHAYDPTPMAEGEQNGDGPERRARARRALPDRRQQPRLPRLLRPAGVDRDLRRAADERDLRARLDDGQAAHRPQAAGSRRRLGRGLVRPREDLRGLQGAALLAPRPAQGAVAAPDAAGRGLRLHQHRGSRASRPTT